MSGKQRNDTLSALRQLGKGKQQDAKQRQKELLERQAQLTQLQSVNQTPKLKQTGIVIPAQTSRQTTQQVPKLDQMFKVTPVQTTRQTPAQGTRQTDVTIPKLDIPTRTRTVPDNPFYRLTTTPPPSRPPPPRKPDSQIPKIELPKIPTGGGLGLLGPKPKRGKTDVDVLGVANPLFTALDIKARRTGRHSDSEGMFVGTTPVKLFGEKKGESDDIFGLGSLGGASKGKKGKKSKSSGGLL